MKLRLPADLKARVNESAALAGRSLNAEIVYRLNTSFLLEESPNDLKLSPGQLLAFDQLIERLVDKHMTHRAEDDLSDRRRDEQIE